MEKCSMLVIMTPDKRLHGQRLTAREAAELGRRLLELRGEIPTARGPRHAPKHAEGRKGRRKITLVGTDLAEVVKLRERGVAVTAIAEATHHGVDVVKRSLEAFDRAQDGVQAR